MGDRNSAPPPHPPAPNPPNPAMAGRGVAVPDHLLAWAAQQQQAQHLMAHRPPAHGGTASAPFHDGFYLTPEAEPGKKMTWAITHKARLKKTQEELRDMVHREKEKGHDAKKFNNDPAMSGMKKKQVDDLVTSYNRNEKDQAYEWEPAMITLETPQGKPKSTDGRVLARSMKVILKRVPKVNNRPRDSVIIDVRDTLPPRGHTGSHPLNRAQPHEPIINLNGGHARCHQAHSHQNMPHSGPHGSIYPRPQQYPGPHDEGGKKKEKKKPQIHQAQENVDMWKQGWSDSENSLFESDSDDSACSTSISSVSGGHHHDHGHSAHRKHSPDIQCDHRRKSSSHAAHSNRYKGSKRNDKADVIPNKSHGLHRRSTDAGKAAKNRRDSESFEENLRLKQERIAEQNSYDQQLREKEITLAKLEGKIESMAEAKEEREREREIERERERRERERAREMRYPGSGYIPRPYSGEQALAFRQRPRQDSFYRVSDLRERPQRRSRDAHDIFDDYPDYRDPYATGGRYYDRLGLYGNRRNPYL